MYNSHGLLFQVKIVTSKKLRSKPGDGAAVFQGIVNILILGFS